MASSLVPPPTPPPLSQRLRDACSSSSAAASSSASSSRRIRRAAGPGRPELAALLRRHYEEDVGWWEPYGAATAPATTAAAPAAEAAAEAAAAPAPAAGAAAEAAAAAAALPIVYDERYNLSLFGIERLHPFDAHKCGRVIAGLEARGVLGTGSGGATTTTFVRPRAPLGREALLRDGVHSARYLDGLEASSARVAEVMELAPLRLLPAWLARRKVLRPMRWHAAGTVLAAAAAVVNPAGWAINVGGGMHHASYDQGSGWCPYADISAAVARLRRASAGAVSRVVVVDLDVHQGNGVGRDKLRGALGGGDSDGGGGAATFIVDVYNAAAFPLDEPAKAAIDVRVELRPGTGGAKYLRRLGAALDEAERRCCDLRPFVDDDDDGDGDDEAYRQQGLPSSGLPPPPPVHLVVYNAGTDVLEGDPLGGLRLSPADVAARDAMVWDFARRRLRAPVVMLLSGGYTRRTHEVIADSIAAVLRQTLDDDGC